MYDKTFFILWKKSTSVIIIVVGTFYNSQQEYGKQTEGLGDSDEELSPSKSLHN